MTEASNSSLQRAVINSAKSGNLVAAPSPLSEVDRCLDDQNAELRLFAAALDELVLKLSPVITNGELPPSPEGGQEKVGRNCQIARVIEAQTDRITSMRFLVNSATANLCI